MTRQKKELEKKIENLEATIQAEDEMGCGFTPRGWFDSIYEEIDKILLELASIRHYDSINDMLSDPRQWGSKKPVELPFY